LCTLVVISGLVETWQVIKPADAIRVGPLPGVEGSVHEVAEVAEVGALVEDSVPRVGGGVTLDGASTISGRRRELEVERVGVALDGRQVDAVDLAVRRLVSLVLIEALLSAGETGARV